MRDHKDIKWQITKLGLKSYQFAKLAGISRPALLAATRGNARISTFNKIYFTIDKLSLLTEAELRAKL